MTYDPVYDGVQKWEYLKTPILHDTTASDKKRLLFDLGTSKKGQLNGDSNFIGQLTTTTAPC